MAAHIAHNVARVAHNLLARIPHPYLAIPIHLGPLRLFEPSARAHRVADPAGRCGEDAWGARSGRAHSAADPARVHRVAQLMRKVLLIILFSV